MIISEAQVRRALEYLQTTKQDGIESHASAELPEELRQRIRAHLESLPDTREERIEEAKRHLDTGEATSEEVASKMIGRFISDSLR